MLDSVASAAAAARRSVLEHLSHGCQYIARVGGYCRELEKKRVSPHSTMQPVLEALNALHTFCSCALCRLTTVASNKLSPATGSNDALQCLAQNICLHECI